MANIRNDDIFMSHWDKQASCLGRWPLGTLQSWALPIGSSLVIIGYENLRKPLKHALVSSTVREEVSFGGLQRPSWGFYNSPIPELST